VTSIAPVNGPRSPRAVAWKVALLLIPLITAGGLLYFREAQVARLGRHTMPRFGAVPAFELVDQDGRPFGSQQLHGKIWIADFIYTTCPGPCPMISSRISEMQKPLQDTDVKLVSFSVDPEHDTPAVLRNYGAALHAKKGRWEFLTGNKSAIYRLSRDGFKLATGTAKDRKPLHSTRVILVDRKGEIRGYYNATDADAVTRLLADINHLLHEQLPAGKGG
jgi:protein SCO1/2